MLIWALISACCFSISDFLDMEDWNSSIDISWGDSWDICSVRLFSFALKAFPSSRVLLSLLFSVTMSIESTLLSICFFWESRESRLILKLSITALDCCILASMSFIFASLSDVSVSSVLIFSNRSSLLYFPTRDVWTNSLYLDFAISSLCSIGMRPIHLDRILPLSASPMSIISSSVLDVADIIRS